MSSRSTVASALVGIALAVGACADSTQRASDGTIKMSVTDNGFEPARLSVDKGQPVRLEITRKTDRTCATEIVIDEYNVRADLPLNQPVTVTFTPTESGEVKYGCAMDKMIGGVISIK